MFLRRIWMVFLFAGAILLGIGRASAGWETGVGAGFDTNVDQAVDGGESDTFLSGHVAFGREPDGESRLDWTATVVAEGAAYASATWLDYAAITFSPGMVYVPRPGLSVAASAFLQAKGVKDDDQSAWAFGGRFECGQRLAGNIRLGGHYAYTDSRANVETFSYTEHAVGASLGVNWTRTVSTEFGYEFSRGDAFRSMPFSATVSSGGGGFGRWRDRVYSEDLGVEVAKDRVDRHVVGITAGIDWTPKIQTLANYTFTTMNGDLGASSSHSGYVSVGYRF